MTKPTKTCASVLNTFSIILFIAGIGGMSFALPSAAEYTSAEIAAVVAWGLSLTIAGTLLRSMSEVLRLLSSITRKLTAIRSDISSDSAGPSSSAPSSVGAESRAA